MNTFFGENLLLSTPCAIALYDGVRELPIIDCHCHLDEKAIAENQAFSDLGELWLAADHYKWRAMRLCGVDEYYITGGASFREKFMAYAEIFPKLCGSPLYYWTQLELKLMFDIQLPLNAQNAEEIYRRANEKLSTVTVASILEQFKVQYIATTDDPVWTLSAHGDYNGVAVRPTFRPDRLLSMDNAALSELAAVSGSPVDTLDEFKSAMLSRLDFFCEKGCRMTDHGMDFLPLDDCGEAEASELYSRRDRLTAHERSLLSSHLLYFLAGEYKKRGMAMQLHFATFRNVNSALFAGKNRDIGIDIMRGEVDTDALVHFLDTLNSRSALPKTILYTLNPAAAPALATLSGAFPNVYVGAAWWFNDTVNGIRRQLETVAEYGVLGTNLGMLTDSRSFASYVRFDFFRRILADLVGGYVERGEYDMAAAKQLMYDVSYGNIQGFLGL